MFTEVPIASRAFSYYLLIILNLSLVFKFHRMKHHMEVAPRHLVICLAAFLLALLVHTSSIGSLKCSMVQH